MKTIKNYGSIFLLVVLMLGGVSTLNAQGKGHGRDNNPGKGRKENAGRGHDKQDVKNRHDDRDHQKHDYRNDNRDNDRDHYTRDNRDNDRDRYSRNTRPDYSRERYRYKHHVTYNHYRYRRPLWAPVYGYHYNTRYIYYNDYNVYYDCYRDVFITWTGRRWVVTHIVPAAILHVNFGNAYVTGVDYWDDDFDFYLAKRRPAYVSIQVNF